MGCFVGRSDQRFIVGGCAGPLFAQLRKVNITEVLLDAHNER